MYAIVSNTRHTMNVVDHWFQTFCRSPRMQTIEELNTQLLLEESNAAYAPSKNKPHKKHQ